MQLKFDQQGLLPVVVQEASSGQVLMLAYMNADALELTRRTGRAHYYSRSRQCLWPKGETSGNKQWVQSMRYDCDADALLLLVRQEGNACHTGHHSCFFEELELEGVASESDQASRSFISELYQLLEERQIAAPPGSYSGKLLGEGVDRIAKKVVEEAGEVVIAAKNRSREELVYELADLCFHSLLLMVEQGVTPPEVVAELQRRRQ
jgi:phosphoribosyl-ATP pyrophosphohydrolase/phosphoribosyl-AMP cyclohydrolase